MDGVGWGGVALIWLFFLWPAIASILVYKLKSSILPIANKTAYWYGSIFVGYVLSFTVGLCAKAIAMILPVTNELVFSSLAVLSLLFLTCVPVGAAIWVAKKCS